MHACMVVYSMENVAVTKHSLTENGGLQKEKKEKAASHVIHSQTSSSSNQSCILWLLQLFKDDLVAAFPDWVALFRLG